MLNKYNIKIHFAHRTFSWSNEAKGNAAVHVVIIGFANYDTNNNLVNASYNNGYKIVYAYYDTLTLGSMQAYRVKKAQETNQGGTILGQELNIIYEVNKTTFADYNGNTNIYLFNNSGNTISIQDPDGNAQYYKYDDTNVNKVGLSSKLQKTVVNLLKNHNVEIVNSDWTLGSVNGSTGSGLYTTAEKYIANKSLSVTNANTAYLMDFSYIRKSLAQASLMMVMEI